MLLQGSALIISVIVMQSIAYQGYLDLKVEKEVEVDGVGMGVLSDGTPYLTARGLARLCGVDGSVITRLGIDWTEELQKPRVNWIKNLLRQRGVLVASPYTECKGVKVWTGDVCLAVLEYYAFGSNQVSNVVALDNFRSLAAFGFEKFVYSKVGYDPDRLLDDKWKSFHDRVTLVNSTVPIGFFCVFKEISDLFVTLGQHGLHADHKFIPDLSVGRLWSQYWVENGLEQSYGARTQYEHNYPDYFPQAASNPQRSWCYPEESLGAFKAWCREEYVSGGRLQTYLSGQVKKNKLSADFTDKALAVIKKSALPKP